MQNTKKTLGEKVTLRYAWYALTILFLVNLINYIDRLSIGPAMEYLKRDFRVSDMKMGLIYSAFILVYAIISVPMGILSDRGRRTRIVALGIAVWSFATTISGFMKNFWAFFAARAVVGSGEGIYAPSGNAIVADYFPKRLRNTAIAIFMSAMIVGGALAYIVAGLILKKTDRFDMNKIASLLQVKNKNEINGWRLIRLSETVEHYVSIEFQNYTNEYTNEKTTIILSPFNEKKKTMARTLLFNINLVSEIGNRQSAGRDDQFGRLYNRKSPNYQITKLPNPQSPPAFSHQPSVLLLNTIVQKIHQREGLPLSENKHQLKSLPSHFKIPYKYSKRIFYNKDKKEFIFKGIMTKKDKKALLEISDNEHYQKIINAIYSDTNHYYTRSDNWRYIFWILGPPGLLIALLAFFLKEPLKGGAEEFLTEEEARKVEKRGKTDYTVLYRTPSVVIMLLSNILATYCIGGLNAWLFPFVERFKGIESAEAAIKLGPIVVGFAVLGVIISGIAADKLAKVTPLGNNIIIVLGLLLGTPFMYLFLYAENYFLTVASISMCIFFLTWVNGPMNALLMSLVEPRLRATLNAFNILLMHLLGDALSPIIIGHFSDKVNLRYALAVLPAFLIAGSVGFALSTIFVSSDLKKVEHRMKQSTA